VKRGKTRGLAKASVAAEKEFAIRGKREKEKKKRTCIHVQGGKEKTITPGKKRKRTSLCLPAREGADRKGKKTAVVSTKKKSHSLTWDAGGNATEKMKREVDFPTPARRTHFPLRGKEKKSSSSLLKGTGRIRKKESRKKKKHYDLSHNNKGEEDLIELPRREKRSGSLKKGGGKMLSSSKSDGHLICPCGGRPFFSSIRKGRRESKKNKGEKGKALRVWHGKRFSSVKEKREHWRSEKEGGKQSMGKRDFGSHGHWREACAPAEKDYLPREGGRR